MATPEGVAAARVARWMQDVGAESLSDLAYYFESFQEALDSAGRAVADAWMSAQTVQGGLASQARPRYRAEAAASQPGAPTGVVGAAAERLLPSRVVRPRAGRSGGGRQPARGHVGGGPPRVQQVPDYGSQQLPLSWSSWPKLASRTTAVAGRKP